MMTATHNKMIDVISTNPVFVNGGRVGLLSYFAMIFGKWLNIVDVNVALTIVVGVLSAIFLVMQIYFVYLKTKREKREQKREQKGK